MKKSKVVSISKVSDETVYALETTTGTFIADGVYHHNCSFRCNRMRSGEYEKYRLALKDKYGDKVPESLENTARLYPSYKFSRDELQEIIDMSKEYVLAYSD